MDDPSGFVGLVDDDGVVKDNLKLPDNDLGKEIKAKFDNGDKFYYCILICCGNPERLNKTPGPPEEEQHLPLAIGRALRTSSWIVLQAMKVISLSTTLLMRKSQQFPPVNVWEALRQNLIPSFPPGHPCSFPLGVAPLEVSSPRLERPEEAPPSAPPRSGVFTPTTAGLFFSSDSAPSTLGLCCPMVPLLVAQRPPVSFWQTFRPFGVAPPEDSAPQVERPEAAPSSAPPSTSGLGFSTKRTWEEACREEDYTYTLNSRPPPSSENSVMESPAGDEAPPRSGVFAPTTPGLVFSTKRIREDDSSDSALSTSGPGFSTKRIREDDSRDSAPSTLCLCCPMVPLLVAQRPPVTFWQTFRPFGVAPPEDSAPQVERPEAAPSSAPPSTSGLGFSTKRTWEEVCMEEDFRESPTTTSGLGLSTKRTRQEDFRDSPTPTSGVGLSTKRTREEDFRDLTPSSSGPWPPMDKRYRPEDHRLPEDSDSD
ncbi:Eukaryotic translation initiation factor 5A-1 [Dissostichus eleginoides]|uniref:Eukaryotic translation initiation factor 5A-1 n=1 Tax=Dissostichus eleginoides TaxID=100907 RepID=A0AAD9C4E4_DISEL|nr:Eukaryotic translation initiation factor 5A-1 [Dissostichus eleginoides]